MAKLIKFPLVLADGTKARQNIMPMQSYKFGAKNLIV